MTDNTIDRIDLMTDIFTFDPIHRIYSTNFSMIGNYLDITETTEINLVNPRLQMMNRIYKFDSYYEEKISAYIFTPENYDTMLVIFDE